MFRIWLATTRSTKFDRTGEGLNNFTSNETEKTLVRYAALTFINFSKKSWINLNQFRCKSDCITVLSELFFSLLCVVIGNAAHQSRHTRPEQRSKTFDHKLLLNWEHECSNAATTVRKVLSQIQKFTTAPCVALNFGETISSIEMNVQFDQGVKSVSSFLSIFLNRVLRT